MKKILIVLLFLVFILAAGIFIFAVTFDANRYRPTIEKEAARFLGNPVKIGNIALGWRGGLALEVDGVEVLSNDEPVLRVQSAGAVLQVAPLLRRSVQVASVFIDGADVRVIKDRNGLIKVMGVSPKTGEAAVPSEVVVSGGERASSSGINPAISSFLISHVDLKNLDVHYQDDFSSSPLQFDLQDLALNVKNVSFFKPMEFKASGAFFGPKKNVDLSGTVKLENNGNEIRISELRLETDLDLIERESLGQSFPQVMATVPFSDWGGKMSAEISQLRIRGGKPDSISADFFLKDAYLETPESGRFAEKIDITARNINLSSPFDVQVKAGIFSGSPNFSFQGKVEASNLGRVIVGPAQADLDLNALNWNQIEMRVPGMQASPLAGAPEGRVHTDIRRLVFEPNRSPFGDIDFRYDQGKIRFKNLSEELRQIQLTGNLRGDQLSLDAWNMNLGSSPAEGRLNIQNVFTAPVFRAEFRARNLNLKELVPPAAPGEPGVEGILSIELSAGGTGKTAEVILPSISGSGHLRVDDAVLRNMNVLEEILSKLSAIPGLSSALDERMSDQLKERRARRDTPFENIDEDFTIDRGVIRFNQFDLVSPDVRIGGSVNAGLDSSIQARPTIWIHEEIMAELADRVKELAYALNSQGQLQIPLTITGTVAHMSILPDIQYLLSEIVRNKAGQMLAAKLSKKTENSDSLNTLSQFLGTTTGSQNTQTQQSSDMATQPIDDNSVPVRVHRQDGSASNARPSNTEIAAGLINAFLSGNSSDSQNTNGNQ